MKFPLPSSSFAGSGPSLDAKKSRQAFTLVELLVSVGIFSIVLVAMGEMVNAVLNQLRIAEARFSQFQESQAAFDSMTRRLSTCEINPYYDYQYPGSPPDTSAVPTKYDLESDLHFVTGPSSSGSRALLSSGDHPTHAAFFHGTYGLTDTPAWQELGTLLNSWGYFLEFGDDDNHRATFLNDASTSPKRYRYRLKELQVPAEELRTYAAKLNTKNSATDLYAWFRTAVTANHSHTLAENVVALVISPLLASPDASVYEKETDLAPDYFYDTRAYQHNAASTNLMQRTRHKLPPLLQITLVAIDEASAQRLADEHGSSMPNLYPGNLFTDATRLNEDLTTLEATLTERKLRYRVFTTTIRLRNAKWTSNP
ncbi:Verru_Chthon cassette protein C [Phragmitibacter flavus]|uniref:Verru_Chthon cassette protein C n=1 Tax=Phragmitibacter flavus TaxID=2576071 RepID=A0A5R8K8E1_9BACT|nr:Verru_Chthon cassette protein C [Phragmitibacter flavus]TLD68560.1 Verru_Chthon cassette protein C [Phragmitibacter flavus]